nr:MAG TPA: hypothetical protein [Caudoviricetes sp.]
MEYLEVYKLQLDYINIDSQLEINHLVLVLEEVEVLLE